MQTYPKNYFRDLNKAWIILPIIGMGSFIVLLATGNFSQDYSIFVIGMLMFLVTLGLGLAGRKKGTKINKYEAGMQTKGMSPGLSIWLVIAVLIMLAIFFVSTFGSSF